MARYWHCVSSQVNGLISTVTMAAGDAFLPKSPDSARDSSELVEWMTCCDIGDVQEVLDTGETQAGRW
ncbi:MAG: hypothetical protein ACT4NP_10885 [Pseudonocardiales bacterium]